MESNRMILCLFMGATGYHSASWRLAGSHHRAGTDPTHFAELARLAEQGSFDAVFFADSMALWSDVRERPAGSIEPSILATAAIAATERLGVILTLSTSFNEPFNVARRLASLDHLSHGRIGWNIVTSATREAAGNFGLDAIPDHDERYRRGNEFVEVCIKLWESWDPQAVVGDRDGWWADPDKIQPIEHGGQFFRVRGPLDIPRSPQGVPLLVQAGSSSEGVELAARFADWVFTVQSSCAHAENFRQEVRRLARAHHPDRLPKVLPGLIPIVRDTDAEAEAYLAGLDHLLDLANGLRQLEKSLAMEPGSLSLDEPFDFDLPDSSRIAGNQTYFRVIKMMDGVAGVSVRDVVRRMSTSRGHRLVVGSPASVARKMREWVDQDAADGYIIMPAVLPGDFEVFVDKVVPLLRESGHLADEQDSRPLAERYRVRHE